MRFLAYFSLAYILTACTYSISLVHTEGQASDVIDDTDNITPTTNVSVPVSPL